MPCHAKWQMSCHVMVRKHVLEFELMIVMMVNMTVNLGNSRAVPWPGRVWLGLCNSILLTGKCSSVVERKTIIELALPLAAGQVGSWARAVQEHIIREILTKEKPSTSG